jgi:hypothetical protein
MELVPYEKKRNERDARRELRPDGSVLNIPQKSPIDEKRDEQECRLEISILNEEGEYIPGASRKPNS